MQCNREKKEGRDALSLDILGRVCKDKVPLLPAYVRERTDGYKFSSGKVLRGARYLAWARYLVRYLVTFHRT